MGNISELQRAENTERQHRKAERGVARAIAQRHVAEDMVHRLADPAAVPEYFTAEQVAAYRDEVERLRGRIGQTGAARYLSEKCNILARGRT